MVKEVNRLFWKKIQEGQLYYNTGRGVGITVKKTEGHNNWIITIDGDSEFAKKVHIKKNAIAAAEYLESEMANTAAEYLESEMAKEMAKELQAASENA